MSIVIVLVYIAVSYGQCTYQQYETDPERWGGGYCHIVNDTAIGCDPGTCILNECYCPGDRGGTNCQYVRFDREVQGSLGVILGIFGVGFINEFIVHNFAFAVGQLLITLVGALMLFTAFRFAKEQKHKFALIFLGICIIAVACTWSIVDGILILSCRAKDGNGYSYAVKV